jgi:hypothetical protein
MVGEPKAEVNSTEINSTDISCSEQKAGGRDCLRKTAPPQGEEARLWWRQESEAGLGLGKIEKEPSALGGTRVAFLAFAGLGQAADHLAQAHRQLHNRLETLNHRRG